MKNITTQQVNKAKKEIKRLKALKKRFSNEPEAQDDLNNLIQKQVRFVARGQEIIEDRKIKPLC
jgi:hypothetical protein